MKKSTIVLSVIAGVTGLCLSISVNAQTQLYAPGGTVGNISGTNVGVGTSTPASYAKLDVRGGALQVVNYSTDGYGYIGRSTDPGNDSYFYHRITTNYHILGTNKNGSGTLRKLGFAVGGGDVETDIKMTIDNIGRVGIGTTTPSTKLEVNGKLTLNSSGWDDHLQITRGASYGGKFIPDNSAGTYGLRLDLIGTGSNFCVMNGNVGINNPAPSAKLQVTNGSVLFDGTTGTTPVSGAGTRMMWIPAKAAFRAGYVFGTSWDDANIGAYSFASGRTTIGKGVASFAAGSQTTASGDVSTAFGNGTTAQSFNSFVLGINNYNPGTYSSDSWVVTDPLFVIANGYVSPSNALTILKNANTGIGTPNPEAKLHIQSILGTSGSGKIALDVLQWSNANLGWNSFYQGFNISRSTSTSNWTTGTDGARNGAVAMISGLGGDINLACIPSSGTTPATLTDAQVIAATKLRILANGNVGIGTTLANNPNNYKLAVAGIIGAKVEVMVENISTTWPDYVFESPENRMNYVEKEVFIKKFKHLPNIDSAKEIQKDGLMFVKTLAGLTQNVEENALDIIDLSKQNAELKKELESLKKELNALKNK